MELTKEKTRNTEARPSNEVEESITLEINKEAHALIMDRLTDMYADKVGSLIRELVSNALDATVNNKGCVTIITPDDNNYEFIVKDGGVGMNEEEIKNIYTKYGASTKKDDFNAIGSYGLGAKVPLAYTDNFFVDTIKNGEKIKGRIVKTKTETLFEILSKEKVTEPSGTTIRIPVKEEDIFLFRTKVNFYEKHKETLTSPVKIIRKDLTPLEEEVSYD